MAAAFDDGINSPACLPGVIKVGAVANDGVGNARGFFNATQGSNVVDPSNFPGEDFWLAPGGGNGTFIQSSVLVSQYQGFSGTSMAAPQIAGLCATAKAVNPALTVSDIPAWFIGNAGVTVPMTRRHGRALGFGLRRILLSAP